MKSLEFNLQKRSCCGIFRQKKSVIPAEFLSFVAWRFMFRKMFTFSDSVIFNCNLHIGEKCLIQTDKFGVKKKGS